MPATVAGNRTLPGNHQRRRVPDAKGLVMMGVFGHAPTSRWECSFVAVKLGSAL